MSRTPPSSIALAPWSDCNDDADCPSPPTLHASDNIPDGGYGWVCVAACFSVNCFTWGVVASYGVYLACYLRQNHYPHAGLIDYAFIGGFNFSMAMLVAPFVTISARKFGTQLCMAIGAILLATGFICASFAKAVWQLYLSQGVLVGFGSLSNEISAASSGIGGLIFCFASEAMISNISLAWSLRITGIICGFMNITAAMFIRSRNETIKPPQRGFDIKLLCRYDVSLLLAWGFISMLGYIALLFSLSDFARSIGLSHTEAATVSAFLNLGSAIGRPFIGLISDYYGRMETAGLLTFGSGITCFVLWLPATSYGLTIVFAIINGAVLGVFWVTIGPLSVEVAGLAEVPSLLSLSWISIILPTTFSEIIALKLRRPDSGREYLFPQLFAGISYIVASGCMFELRRFKGQGKKQGYVNNRPM